MILNKVNTLWPPFEEEDVSINEEGYYIRTPEEDGTYNRYSEGEQGSYWKSSEDAEVYLRS